VVTPAVEPQTLVLDFTRQAVDVATGTGTHFTLDMDGALASSRAPAAIWTSTPTASCSSRATSPSRSATPA
jgi:hypothetical protein